MLPTRAYNRTLLNWGSVGEFDDVENYFCTASILRDIPRAKKQICEENKAAWNPPNIIECDRCNHWFHFKPVCKIALFIMIIVVCFHCFVLLKFVKV